MADSRTDRKAVSRVAVIGCGRIGSLWDESASSKSHKPLTHAAAYQSHPRAQLIALCDLDEQRLHEAGRRRGVSALFSSLEDLLSKHTLDVASLCTPPSARLDSLRKLIDSGCRVIFCEKPLAAGLAEALEIQALAYTRPTRIVLNYQRRWDPVLRTVRAMVRARELGDVQKAVGLYGKGLANNGSHLIDLANFFFGTALRARCLGSAVPGSDERDPTLDAQIMYRSGTDTIPVLLGGTNHHAYTVFELDIHLQGGRIRISERGQRIEIFRAAPDPKFPDYRVLSEPDVRISDGAVTLADGIDEVVELDQETRSEISCGVEEGVAVLAVIDAIHRSARRHGAEVPVQAVPTNESDTCQ